MWVQIASFFHFAVNHDIFSLVAICLYCLLTNYLIDFNPGAMPGVIVAFPGHLVYIKCPKISHFILYPFLA